MNINRQYITKINFTDKNNVARIKYIVIHYCCYPSILPEN